MRPTIKFLLAAALASHWIVAAAKDDVARSCPKLPADAGLAWTLSVGPDFDVCRAEGSMAGQRVLIGVYLGFAPQFSADSAPFTSYAGWGRMNGQPVRWHHKRTGDANFKLGLETLVNAREIPAPKLEGVPVSEHWMLAHVWILARDSQGLEAMRSIAEKIDFQSLK